jgi:hypothetical protein
MMGLRRASVIVALFLLEERRHTKIIPHAFGDGASSLVSFEQRQLRAIRAELNRAHTERVAPAVTATLTTPVRKPRAEPLSQAHRRNSGGIAIEP